MIDEAIAQRYADAYLSYARGTIGFEKSLEELQEVKRIIRDNRDFKSFLEAPDFIPSEKAEAIDTILGNNYSAEIRNFLKLLIRNKRIGRFIDIAEFARLEYTHGVEHDAVLQTSYTVDTEVLQEIKDALEKRTKKKLHLYIRMEPDLLGGVTARVGNIIIDGSVKRRLMDLREKLTTVKVA
jgi:F-type H+-transporting ATPase subunit delta